MGRWNNNLIFGQDCPAENFNKEQPTGFTSYVCMNGWHRKCRDSECKCSICKHSKAPRSPSKAPEAPKGTPGPPGLSEASKAEIRDLRAYGFSYRELYEFGYPEKGVRKTIKAMATSNVETKGGSHTKG